MKGGSGGVDGWISPPTGLAAAGEVRQGLCKQQKVNPARDMVKWGGLSVVKVLNKIEVDEEVTAASLCTSAGPARAGLS